MRIQVSLEQVMSGVTGYRVFLNGQELPWVVEADEGAGEVQTLDLLQVTPSGPEFRMTRNGHYHLRSLHGRVVIFRVLPDDGN